MTSEERSDEVDAIRSRLAAATPGPWITLLSDDGRFYGQPPTFDVVQSVGGRDEPVACGGVLEDGGPRIGACEQPDAEFIANAPTDIAALLTEVAALRTENGRLTAYLKTQNAELRREVEHERELNRRYWRELWQAVHDRNDAPDYWLIDQSALICAVQDAPTVAAAESLESR